VGCAECVVAEFPPMIFMATTKLKFLPNPKLEEERAGLGGDGMSYG